MITIHSLRTKILLIVLVFVVIMCGAFLAYTLITSENYKQLRLEGIEKTVEYETERVNKIILEIERGAMYYAFGGTLCYDTQSEELGKRLAVEYLSKISTAVGGGFWFEPYAFNKDIALSFFYAYYDDKTGEVRTDITSQSAKYDYLNKIWYRELIENISKPDQVVWTKPHVDDSGRLSLMTTSGAGIFNANGELIGISTVDWEIDDVIKQLTEVKPTENSFVILCVPKSDYIISSTRTKSVAGAKMESLPWDITADVFEFEGVTYLRFERYINNGWLVSVQIPKNEIFAEMESDNRNFSIFIGVLTIIMFFFVFMLISEFINTPIKRLTDEVSQIAFGKLDSISRFSSKDELGQLAKVFNKITVDLKESIEKNIHERAQIERIEAELDVATEIQASMLPNVFPPFQDRNEFELYASMFPARHVGGDFYDFYFVDKDNLAIVIADVLGKGVPAALFMVVTKTLIENCSFSKSPKKVFEMVNKKLMKNNKAGMFVTAFMGFYNIPTGKFIYANAGHNPPFLKKSGGSFEFLKTEHCTVLAWMENLSYDEQEITLEKGDTLYLYTDGVTEAMNARLELYSEQRLEDTLNKNKNASMKKLLEAVKGDVDKFCGDTEQNDDITMLAIKIGKSGEMMTLERDEKMKETRSRASLDSLSALIDFVNRELITEGCKTEIINEIDIAVEEIFMNIVNYAYDSAGGEVNISIYVDNKVEIRFEDTGKPYNPLKQKSPDLSKPPKDRDIGGLGIFMVNNIMDYMEYSRLDGKNILVISKNLSINKN